jgi:hypothetical protein
MNLVSFISETKLKAIVPISNNVTITSSLTQLIIDAQEQYIKPIICEDLYEELSNEIINNSITPDNQILLDMIAPALAWRTLFKFLPWSYAKVREQGVVNQTGNTANSVSLDDITYLRSEADHSAIVYENRLVNFLDKNKSTYPLYKCECNCNTICDTDSSKTRSLFDMV